MANGYFERGEIYWAKMGSGMGMEMNVTRPALIVSAEKYNSRSDLVVVAFLSLHGETCPRYVETYATGKLSRVLCNQVQSVDKSRFTKLLGVMPSDDMREVEDALEEVFDLGYADTAAMNEKDREIESLKVKIAELTGEVAREQTRGIEQQAKHEDELLSYKMENTMWQKCYERTMDMLVRTTVEGTYAGRIVRETPRVVPEAGTAARMIPDLTPPKEPENPPAVDTPAADIPVKDTRVDINHCTQTQLKKIGFSDALARAVVAKRPFESVEDLRNVQGMNKKKFQILEPKLRCTPLEIIVLDKEPEQPEEPVAEVVEVVEPEVVETAPETEGKLNINAVSGRELMEATGVSSATAYSITGYRRKNGPYAKLEDIMNAPKITVHIIDRIRDKIYCGPGIEEQPIPTKRQRFVEPVEEYTGPKVNINTASAQEIHGVTGLSMTVCYGIVGCRKRDGNYRDVSDLENVPRFTEYHMKKYGPMFEV